MTIDNAPYPNSKGEDIDTPPVNKLPKVQKPDFSKVQGHACTKIPAFLDRQHRFESLSGSYYRTKADGSYDGVEFDPKKHSNQLKTVEENGKKLVVTFYNYGGGSKNIDIEFDPKKNVLCFSCRIVFLPKRVISNKDGKEYPYENQKSDNIDVFLIENREITEEIINFIQEKQGKVNELINYVGYYFSPSDCNIAGGCTCSIPVIMKVSMQVQHASEPQSPLAHYINLYPSASRADASNWGEIELKKTIKAAESIYKVINGTPTKVGEKPQEEIEMPQDVTSVFLHEAAHLFGFPDEYFEGGGAVHKMYIKPDTQTVDINFTEPQNDWKRKVDGHLMSSPLPGKMPIIPAYYYERFREYFENKTGVRWKIKKTET
ncbi:hypothetical protein M2R48_07820 [Acinetobacter sp. I-MWF]|uniref:hypothetical protein n=1 Tax=Acinetobacter sp. I-MWF TaxID=2940517 RepID=UPI0021C9E056|nr:hypothetical protein [Acinetobacter sp. I-MWF]MCT9978230.1 hypothetical protein [Acinetobacter sp. I-MWF]